VQGAGAPTLALYRNAAGEGCRGYYDGPAVTLSVGTWLLQGTVSLDGNDASITHTAKLWDGTTVGASGHALTYGGAAGRKYSSVALSCVVVVASGTPTWKISAAGNGGGGAILAAAPINGAGNNASTLVAVKIA
jgi:hypothetical protein